MSKYQKLADEQARSMGQGSLPVELDTPAISNAATDGRRIMLNRDFMEEIESSAGEGGVRFILAHELGHVAQGMGGGHGAELDADKFAARSVARSGLDAGAISGVMSRLDSSSSETHPGSGTRVGVAREAWEDESGKRQVLVRKVVRKQRRRREIVPYRRGRNPNVREHLL